MIPGSACDLRYGERHPDRQDAVVLRGMAVERRSRPARLHTEWVSPLSRERAGDKGCPLVRQGGERSVGVRHQSHAAVRAAALTAHSLGDTSFTWSKGPCSSIVTTSPVKAVEGGALGGGSRLGKPGNRRNQHRHLVSRTKRGSTRIPTLARGARGCVRKGRRLRPPSLRGSRESRSECPHVVCSCRSRPRRHLVSNKLTCSTLEKGTRRE